MSSKFVNMEQSLKFRQYKDDWGAGTREGYEDRGTFRPPRAPKKESGSSILRTVGVLAIVGGVLWGTYLVTQGGDVVQALEQNKGPIAVIALGVVASVLGKYLRV
jgi:hypothetical protein